MSCIVSKGFSIHRLKKQSSQDGPLWKWLTVYSIQFKTDVVGCSVEKEDSTQILVTDTYNPAEEKYNAPDSSETATSGHPVGG